MEGRGGRCQFSSSCSTVMRKVKRRCYDGEESEDTDEQVTDRASLALSRLSIEVVCSGWHPPLFPGHPRL